MKESAVESMMTGALVRYLRGLGLHVTERALEFALRSGHLPEPPRLTSGQRLWEPEDVVRTEAYFRERGLKVHNAGKGQPRG